MKRIMILLALICFLPAASAAADEARNITADCTLSLVNKQQIFKTWRELIRDGSYDTAPKLARGNAIEIAGTEEIGGLYVQLWNTVIPFEIQVPSGDGWRTVHREEERFSNWYPLPEGTQRVRLRNAGKHDLRIAELGVYSAGDKPAAVPLWTDPEKADMMLVVAHPDDDLLWFGGLMPTYAGERGLALKVVYAVPTSADRKLELLDALWHCGVTAYPSLLGFGDVIGRSVQDQYRRWGQNTVFAAMTEVIRRYRPDVLVTHGEKGEYGHAAHRTVCDACKRAVGFAADPEKYPKSAEAYGVWQVKKLYLHELTENQIVMDWHRPLSHFDGKDSYQVACEAFAMHASQVKRGWAMEDRGEHDSSLFGLYLTTVGPDTDHDLMEHIP